MKNFRKTYVILAFFACLLLSTLNSLEGKATQLESTRFSFEQSTFLKADSIGEEVRYEFELLADFKRADVRIFGGGIERFYDFSIISPSGETLYNMENIGITATHGRGIQMEDVLPAGTYEFVIKYTGCTEGDTSEQKVRLIFEGTYIVRPTELALSDESIYMMQGRTYQLSATYAPDFANTDTAITWTSSNKAVATVDRNGLVTAVGAGEAIITAKVGELQKTCTFKVEKSQGLFFEAEEMGEYLSKDEKADTNFTMPVKGGIALYFWGEGDGCFYLKQNGKVLWQSKVFDTNGEEVLYMVPIVLEPGKYTITTESLDHYVFHQEGYILYDTVDYYKATAIKLNKKTKTVAIGKQFYLKCSVTPKYATSIVKWTSSNKKVATVDQFGLVTAKRMGKAVITVTVNGKKAKCTVYVAKQNLESWTGKTKDLSKKVKNVPGYKKGKWTSSNPSVASVDSKGKVTYRSTGKAKITLTAKGKKYVFTVYAYSKDKLKNEVIKKVKGYDKQFFPITIQKKTFDNKNFTYTVKFSRYDVFYGHVTYTAIGYYEKGKVKIVDNYNW